MSYPSQISVAEAIKLVQQQAKHLETERVVLTEAYGRVLADDVFSLVDHPSHDNSALDGFACHLEDTQEASEQNPVRLELIGDIPAGSMFEGVVKRGQCVGIYTGAPIPKGANAVIRVEDTEQAGNTVSIIAKADPDAVRPLGQDFKKGDLKLGKGFRLNSAGVAIAAATGHANVNGSRKPRVAILATGDEVIEPGQPLKPGQVYNSNTYSVTGLIQQAGGEPIILKHVADDIASLETAMSQAGQIDLLLTSGGVSMGKYDFVRDLLFEQGDVHFWKIAMRPAGPVLFGTWQGVPVLGLPGNPVSSMIAFIMLAKAFIQKALGETATLPYFDRLEAITAVPLKSAGFKETFVRLLLTQERDGKFHVSTTGNQNSGVLSSMLLADALAVVPPHTQYSPGDVLEVIRLEPYL